MSKFTKNTLEKLEQIFKELEYSVRYEKGTFNAGHCIVENAKVVVINKFFNTDGRVNVLMELLPKVMTNDKLLSERSKSTIKHLFKDITITS